MAAQAAVRALKATLWYETEEESHQQMPFENIYFFLQYGRRWWSFRLESFEDYLLLIRLCYKPEQELCPCYKKAPQELPWLKAWQLPTLGTKDWHLPHPAGRLNGNKQ